MEGEMTMQVPIQSIRLDGNTQSRDGVRQELVNDYAEDMRGGAVFPPVIVYDDGENMWLSEGFHRVYAAQQSGSLEIEAEVRQGTNRDAQLNSMRSNATHGARRTNADKRRAVEMAIGILVEDGKSLHGITGKIISDMTLVTARYVNMIKKEIFEKFSSLGNCSQVPEITKSEAKELTVTQRLREKVDSLEWQLRETETQKKALERREKEIADLKEKHRKEAEAASKHEGEKIKLKNELEYLQKRIEEIEASREKEEDSRQMDIESEIERRLEELKKNIKPETVEKIVEKQVAVEDPATAFRLKKAEEQRDKYEMELKKIQQEGRDWRRLEDKKSKLELEIDKLQMRALEKRAETTLMAALDNVEHSRYISDRIHDMCQRGEMTMEQLDNAERTMTAMVNAGNDCLVVIRAEREGLVKAKGGLRVVE